MSLADVMAICKRKLVGTQYESQDITYAVNEAEFYIRNYTGRWVKTDDVLESLPDEINYIWADIAIGILTIGTAVVSGLSGGGGTVKQIKEGDTTIEFNVGSTGFNAVNALVISYAPDLARFRRLYPTVGEV